MIKRMLLTVAFVCKTLFADCPQKKYILEVYTMRKTTFAAVALATLTLSLAACNSDKKPTQGTTAPVAGTSTEAETSTEAKTSTEAATEAETSTETATEAETSAEAATEAATEAKTSAASAVEGDQNAVTIFNTVWEKFDENEKFSSYGGNIENMVDGAPGAFDLTQKDALRGQYYIPDEVQEKLDDVATMMHMMNANTFTGAVMHVTDAAAVDESAEKIKDSIQGTQWMCGFPDRLVVAQIFDSYIAYGFGAESIIAEFTEKLTEEYAADAVLLYEINLAE